MSSGWPLLKGKKDEAHSVAVIAILYLATVHIRILCALLCIKMPDGRSMALTK